MLILTRKLGEEIYIGKDIKIQVISIQSKQVRLGIEAPEDTMIHRRELYERIVRENKAAANKFLECDDNLVKHKLISDQMLTSTADKKVLTVDKNSDQEKL